MADVKTLLKEARKLIDDKDYQGAQECCKNILRKDKQNYLALVLLGKSLQDSGQAPLAFQKAIASKPDHILAWQGLANYYEKKEDEESKHALLSIYDEMLKLQLENEKILEVITKISQMAASIQTGRIVNVILKVLVKKMEQPLHEFAENQLIKLIKEDAPLLEEDIPTLIALFESMLNNNPNNLSLQLLYAKMIIQKYDFNSSVQKIMNLSFYNDNAELKELLCNYICNMYIKDNKIIDSNFVTDRITAGIENSKYAGLLKSIVALSKSMFLEAYELCIPLVNYNQPSEVEINILLHCTIMIRKWTVAQKLATNFLTKVLNGSAINQLNRYLFIALAKQKKWKQAISAASKLSLSSLDESEQMIVVECYIENEQSAENIIEKLRSTDLQIVSKSLILLKQQKFFDAVVLLENCRNEHPLQQLCLGIGHWELGQYDKSLVHLLKAAKLDPNQAKTFLYLGHYYKKNEDFVKAKKCYEKAYNLDNFSIDIVKSLSDTYIKLDECEHDLELLKHVSKVNNSSDCWIDFRIALHYSNKKDWDNAIACLCNVIKKNPEDVRAFECLADAYYYRGSYTSALKAYNKAIILQAHDISYYLLQIGYIYSLLTQFDDAINTFQSVLKDKPTSMLALKGIAETWIRVAKKKVASKMYGGARECVQFAIDYLIDALAITKEFSCLWKILGDAFLFLTKLPTKYAYAYLKKSFDGNKDGHHKLNKINLFPYAVTCYARVTKLKNEDMSYDLAQAYFLYYKESMDIAHCQVAFNLTKELVKKQPSVWRNWNLFGKIYFNVNKYDIAQHCFIKSLLTTKKWSVAKIWCNLGTLYLKLEQYRLANYCFWRGQSTLPSYSHSWIGQALIAEVLREEEAMDLFRHASRLGYHRESALGYADWVCRTLKKGYINDPEMQYVIDGLHAVPYAIDLMEWYSNFESDSIYACTMLGILKEKYGLLNSSLRSFEKALKCVNEHDQTQKSMALLNIGRVLLRLQKYEEAIELYKSVPEASMDSACGLALSLYRKGFYDEAYAAYDMALHWLCSNDIEKSHLLVAMAGIIYIHKSPDDAKTLLFQSIQIASNKSTPHNLFAICSLGLLNTDQSLSKLALSELQKYDKDVKFGFDIGFLKSYAFLCENRTEEAIKVLSESLYSHPNSSQLWFCMALYCLQMDDSHVRAASTSAQRALCAVRDSQLRNEAAKILATASVAEHLAGNYACALLMSKQGLHIYPEQVEIWAALIYTLLSNKQYEQRKQWLLNVAMYMRRHLGISRVLSRWVSLVEKRLSKLM